MKEPSVFVENCTGASDLEVSLGLANPVNFVLLRYLHNGSNQAAGVEVVYLSEMESDCLAASAHFFKQQTNPT